MKWNENEIFQNYVTRVAFNVSLSHPQILYLCNLHEVGYSAEVPTFIATGEALRQKGLVKRLLYQHPRQPDKFPEWGVDILTEAGLHMVKLLKIAGLYQTRHHGRRSSAYDKALTEFQQTEQARVAKSLERKLKELN